MGVELDRAQAALKRALEQMGYGYAAFDRVKAELQEATRALSPEPVVGQPAEDPQAGAVAAWQALKAAAGSRLAVGRVDPLSPTGLPPLLQAEWVGAWLAVGNPTVQDARVLGEALRARRVWQVERPITVGLLCKHLQALLAEALTPAQQRPSGPSDIEAPRERCGRDWCDGRFHYEQDPDQVRRPQTVPCPRRGR